MEYHVSNLKFALAGVSGITVSGEMNFQAYLEHDYLKPVKKYLEEEEEAGVFKAVFSGADIQNFRLAYILITGWHAKVLAERGGGEEIEKYTIMEQLLDDGNASSEERHEINWKLAGIMYSDFIEAMEGFSIVYKSLKDEEEIYKILHRVKQKNVFIWIDTIKTYV